MMGTKEIPARKDLIDYNYAVAGHAGTLCDPDGELFIKPCTAQEVAFYESANAEHKEFSELMPVFMGTLMLNDATDIASINEQLPVIADHLSEHMKEEVVALAHNLHPRPEPAAAAATAESIASASKWAPGKNKKIATDTAIVLENSAYGFHRPNIMDCKLGVRLWADDAPDEKKRRFDKISSETTHKDLGFRIAGMRVYRGSEDDAELDAEEYKKYDKDWGRLTVTAETIVESMKRFVFNERSGVSVEDGKMVARAFHEELKRVEEVLAREESRMYSASLLFVFEGDGAALRRALHESGEAAARREAVRADREHERLKRLAREASGRSPAGTRVDSGIDVEHDGLIDKDNAAAAAGVHLDDDDFDDDDDDEVSLPRILSLRLIDFAHATWTPGQGPDENVLKGVRSLVRIFDEMGS